MSDERDDGQLPGPGPEAAPEPQREPRRAGFWATFSAVLWSFLGVRRHDAYHRDATSLDPKLVVVVGLLAGLLFVLGLVTVVHFVVGA